ncbi:hypothetical protein SRABI98_03460 [Microbacterium sp. Bi98]|uniref:hypothetical protein n=1 Tax=unclassified Microbacterium TaxID=2609290 RepID=UPI0006FEADCC|nr:MULTISPECIES: hypothetical protein [unclassified Microbacterium]KRD50431.1 hypothetical protein ASE34_12790 [Microbacterium sp. Root280D1]CAH0259181.1 hypothetical protein SRABI98_03460 [Microbacterium sp. Bi98]
MTAQIAEQGSTAAPHRRPQLRPIAILALGVVVVPLAFATAFNSWGALTEDSAMRMAFATVAGQVIAVLTGFLVVGIAWKRRYRLTQIAVLAAIAVAITINAFAIVASTGDLLLSRLDLIAETNLLNQ